ncbi:MAG TPA: hypothetical protein VLU96_02110 [Gaiellaceae bacterium]|nr:hypothetical protein [Gaiellaceae bacterium]
MARGGTRQPLPPPLPPGERTVGQLVAETINLYRRRFWPSLALGLGPAAAAVGLAAIPGWWTLAFLPTVWVCLMTAAYVRAVTIAFGEPVPRRTIWTALAVGYVVVLPAPFLLWLFVLPAVVWIGLAGLAVPAAVIEKRGFRDSLRRGFELGRADPVHAIGSIAALVIVAFLTSTVLFFLLRSGSEAALAVAAFLSLLLISPILFLGAALLYFDQAARATTRRNDADLHHALQPDRAGSADAEGEPRPAPGGQP